MRSQEMTGIRGGDIGTRGIKVRGDGRKHTVHWFRKGLRLHDNPSLREGLIGASTFRCVFVLDPWFAGSTNVSINKWRYLQTVNMIYLYLNIYYNVKVFQKSKPAKSELIQS